MQTVTPSLDRESIKDSTTLAISGKLTEEPPGTIIYVYLNMRRAGTTVTGSDALRRWVLPLNRLSFGGGPAKLKPGDRLYVQARAVGKEMSEPTPVYTIQGLDQPGKPYARDENGQPREIYARDSVIEGDVPLLLEFPGNTVKEVFFTASQGVSEGVTVSIYLEKTFLYQVQSDRNGHWSLDLLSSGVIDHPLMPLDKGQIISVKATRHRVNEDGSYTQLVFPSAEGHVATVLGGFFEQRLFDYYPAVWKSDDASTGDLKAFTKILALTMDEVKSAVDTFPIIFDVERCEPRYFNGIATLLGYPLNRLDSVESQRFQLKNAIEFWRKKGTNEIFRILFYLLDYEVTLSEMWTNDYVKFYPGIMDGNILVYPKESYHEGPPNDAPELVENGGTWYKAPYFAIEINPLTSYVPTPSYPYQTDAQFCPLETSNTSVSLSLDDLKYLLERIDYFRPAHTVLDFIAFRIPIQECGPIPEELVNWGVRWQPAEPGWYLPYCDPDDPLYYRDGVTSTRPDGKGTVTLGITRDPTGPFASTKPFIRMKRLTERGYCHPGEEFIFDLQPAGEEYYSAILNRSGYGIGIYPIEEPLDSNTIDRNDWPYRNAQDPPDRSGRFNGYISRLVFRLEAAGGA